MKLVIVESPSKAKTIEKYLGKGYEVIASKGHIIDLPKSELGIDVEHNFEPNYVVSNQKSLTTIKKAFLKADALVLAVDPDREGEAIGWHIAKKLGLLESKGKKAIKPLERITFTEITKDAVQKAINNPRQIDINLVDAQQARRVLDRLVGYTLSPLLWKKIRYGLSAGRVQSVAVKLIVDREEERDQFKADEYWTVKAILIETKTSKVEKKILTKEDGFEQKLNKDEVLFILNKIDGKDPKIVTQNQADELFNKIENKDWQVKSIDTKSQKKSPKPPFITSTLQQAAANKFGFSATRTMRAAQSLYEHGHITYMRTDSLHMSPEALANIREYIVKSFGQEFLSPTPRTYKSSARLTQEAHECIRPTNLNLKEEGIDLGEDQKKLYDLIWRKAISSQMSDALIEMLAIKVNVENCEFQATESKTKFSGYLVLYNDVSSKVHLPDLKAGQKMYPLSIINEQHFTEPPARYTEATLIKALEQFGIGRPSTYAPTMNTIVARNYIERDGRYLKPTDVGKVVTKLLAKHFKDIVDTNFTAEMENELDEIAEGKRKWQQMMSEFYKPYAKNLQQKQEDLKKEDFTVLGPSDEKCPVCGKAMQVKLGKYGKFLSCVDFPTCKGIKAIEELLIDADDEVLNNYDPAPQSDDGKPYNLKKSRFGYFWAHPDYPKVKDSKPLVLKKDIQIKVYGQTPKSKDGKKMLLRKGKFGEFWAHPDYPKTKEIQRIAKKEVEAKKKELGLLS